MSASQAFPFDDSSIRQARRFAAGQLCGESVELVRTVELLISELATNAVLHARSGFVVDVTVAVDRIQLAVSDDAAGATEIRARDDLNGTGRGLQIVEALSADWGIDRDGDSGGGKTVWCSVARPGLRPVHSG